MMPMTAFQFLAVFGLGAVLVAVGLTPIVLVFGSSWGCRRGEDQP